MTENDSLEVVLLGNYFPSSSIFKSSDFSFTFSKKVLEVLSHCSTKTLFQSEGPLNLIYDLDIWIVQNCFFWEISWVCMGMIGKFINGSLWEWLANSFVKIFLHH